MWSYCVVYAETCSGCNFRGGSIGQWPKCLHHRRYQPDRIANIKTFSTLSLQTRRQSERGFGLGQNVRADATPIFRSNVFRTIVRRHVCLRTAMIEYLNVTKVDAEELLAASLGRQGYVDTLL